MYYYVPQGVSPRPGLEMCVKAAGYEPLICDTADWGREPGYIFPWGYSVPLCKGWLRLSRALGLFWVSDGDTSWRQNETTASI